MKDIENDNIKIIEGEQNSELNSLKKIINMIII